MTISLTTTVAELTALRADLIAHDAAAAKEQARLRAEIAARQTLLNNAEAGLDSDKIALAKTVLKVRGLYAKGGTDRAGVIHDAIRWLATGDRGTAYRGLDGSNYGTKNYDRWQGQRSDHEWGGPSHGSICFQVGLVDRTRTLTPEETEAAIYYLVNLERAQTAALNAQQVAD